MAVPVRLEGVLKVSAAACADGVAAHVRRGARARARWFADACAHPALGPRFRVEWAGGAEEFRAPAPCPAAPPPPSLDAAAAAAVTAECWAGLCGPAGAWPEPCCPPPPCANGSAPAEPGACACACPAGLERAQGRGRVGPARQLADARQHASWAGPGRALPGRDVRPRSEGPVLPSLNEREERALGVNARALSYPPV